MVPLRPGAAGDSPPPVGMLPPTGKHKAAKPQGLSGFAPPRILFEREHPLKGIIFGGQKGQSGLTRSPKAAAVTTRDVRMRCHRFPNRLVQIWVGRGIRSYPSGNPYHVGESLRHPYRLGEWESHPYFLGGGIYLETVRPSSLTIWNRS
ncbi:hypothetical protein AZA_23388 [Nitrospirillum viridazoti Y2]|nr:hypothetical protein AZA_23388 [Nitrospirillum amazonense Y2]